MKITFGPMVSDTTTGEGEAFIYLDDAEIGVIEKVVDDFGVTSSEWRTSSYQVEFSDPRPGGLEVERSFDVKTRAPRFAALFGGTGEGEFDTARKALAAAKRFVRLYFEEGS